MINYFKTWCLMKKHWVEAQLFDNRDMWYEREIALAMMRIYEARLAAYRLNRRYGPLR